LVVVVVVVVGVLLLLLLLVVVVVVVIVVVVVAVVVAAAVVVLVFCDFSCLDNVVEGSDYNFEALVNFAVFPSLQGANFAHSFFLNTYSYFFTHSILLICNFFFFFSCIFFETLFFSHAGGPHENQIAAVAVALLEASQKEFKDYVIQLKLNTKALCKALVDMVCDY
jgi:hypothetical protein